MRWEDKNLYNVTIVVDKASLCGQTHNDMKIKWLYPKKGWIDHPHGIPWFHIENVVTFSCLFLYDILIN